MTLYSKFKSLFGVSSRTQGRKDPVYPGSRSRGVPIPLIGSPKLVRRDRKDKTGRKRRTTPEERKIHRAKPLIGSFRHHLKKTRAAERRERRAAGMR